MDESLARHFERARRELTAYLCRLVVRPQVAEELAQTAFVRCFEASDRLPDTDEGIRAWLFKVATNLAFDELRRHSTWRETMIFDLRAAAEASAELLEQSKAMFGSPETRSIAREHLVACLACTLRNLPERKAAALLLKEVHGFSLAEVSDLLDARPAQAKNWLQEARKYMSDRYGTTCALIAKNGICHQCVELDGVFGAGKGSPLASSDPGVDARLRIAVELREQAWGRWHRLVFGLLDDMC
ncbi:MAG: RNA polymerase sigma factor [Pseudomonadota bacterium]